MGLIAVVKPVMDDLIVEAGYWIDSNLYNEVLQQVGE
jgi:predicted nucleic acid-binding protein